MGYLKLIFQVLTASAATFWLCLEQLFHHFIWSRKQKSVEGQIIVVTGSAHGLGRRIACGMARRGAHVVCLDIDKERNNNTVWDIRQNKGKATDLTCDVTDRADIFKTIAIVRETIGEIDILINCVGVYPVKPSLSWTPEEIYALFDLNVMAQLWLMQAVVPQMLVRKSGHVAVISSAAAMAPVSGELLYSVTKSAITGLMEGFLEELYLLGHDNIKLTCIHPYYTATRDDIPVKFELRFDRMSPDYVANEIVKGILEEQQTISVPRFLLFWLYMLKTMPYWARRRWRDIFYTRVYTTESKTTTNLEGAPNIVDRYRLPPLPPANPPPSLLQVVIQS